MDWLTWSPSQCKGVHVLGDATLSAPAMPKSASMANQHAKVCAAAVIALLKGQPVNRAADDDEYLLQLRGREERDARRLGAPAYDAAQK